MKNLITQCNEDPLEDKDRDVGLDWPTMEEFRAVDDLHGAVAPRSATLEEVTRQYFQELEKAANTYPGLDREGVAVYVRNSLEAEERLKAYLAEQQKLLDGGLTNDSELD